MFDDEYNSLVAFGHRCGVNALDDLLQILGGQKPHIPTPRNFWVTLQREARDEEVRTRFRGNNYEQLAMEYELSERQVRRIVNNEPRCYAKPKPVRSTLSVRSEHHQRLANLSTALNVPLRVVVDVALAIVCEADDLSDQVALRIGCSRQFEFDGGMEPEGMLA